MPLLKLTKELLAKKEQHYDFAWDVFSLKCETVMKRKGKFRCCRKPPSSGDTFFLTLQRETAFSVVYQSYTLFYILHVIVG